MVRFRQEIIYSSTLLLRYAFGKKSPTPQQVEKITKLACARLIDEFPVLGARAVSSIHPSNTDSSNTGCIRSPIGTLWSYVKRSLLKTADIEVVIDTGKKQTGRPDETGIGYLLFDDISDDVINEKALRDPLDEHVGMKDQLDLFF